MEKPTMNYAVAYQRFRTQLNEAIVVLQKEYPLPSYMIEGIVAGILSDIRSGTIAECISEERNFAKETEKYYEDELLKLNAKKENDC